MRIRILLVPLLLIVVLSACSAKKSYNSEFDFGNKLAQEGLWKEAHFRWKKALAEGKVSAALYNNIAIALEEAGEFEKAKEAYEKALKLSPNNQTIRSNLNKLKKHLTKDKDEKKSKKDEQENEE